MSELPIDCLRVLMRAWPLVAPKAFDLRLVKLECSSTGGPTGAAEKLAISLEHRVRELSGELSLDVQGLLRDREWFWSDGAATPKRSWPLSEYVVSLAESYLAPRGPQVVLRDDGGDRDLAADGHPLSRAARWAWVIRYLPADLLISALGTQDKAESLPQTDHVSLVTPQLRALLAERVTQQHLHLGAGASFAMLWSGLMQRRFLTKLDLGARDDDRGDMPFGTGGCFQMRLLQAGLVRLLMADYLARIREGAKVADFTGYLSLQQAELRSHAPRERALHRCFVELIQNLGLGAGTPGAQGIGPLRILYLRGWGRFAGATKTPKTGNTRADLHAQDPLSAWLCPSAYDASPETRFSHLALRHMLKGGKNDLAFSTCYWQYQRIRCSLFRYLTQEPGVAGFDWFRKFYARLGRFTKSLEEFETSLAMHNTGQELRLASFEGRKAPKERADQVLGTIREFAHQSRQYSPPDSTESPPEVGLVLHFVKATEEEIAREQKLSGKAVKNLPFYRRHHWWFKSRAQQARAVHAVLRDHPSVLLIFRGLDVANREMTVATWATACLLGPLRHKSDSVAATLNRKHPQWNVAPLRLTYHSGEEFRRLPEALRRTHELIESDLLRSGDRLGHGLALGFPPRQWAARATAIAQPAEERLDDLLWELDRYARGDIPDAASRWAQVEDEAMGLARQIYQAEQSLSLDALREARVLRHQLSVLQRLGYGFLVGERQVPPIRDAASSGDINFGKGESQLARRLLYRYLYDSQVYADGQRPVLIPQVESELKYMEYAQLWLRKTIARIGVSIESNPSSNLLIGSYGSLEEHPISKMQPIKDGGDSGIPVSINDDNSLTFATCIADEYAHLLYSLQRAGVSTPDALRWLAARRESGWQARFTLSASSETSQIEQLYLAISPTKRLRTRSSAGDTATSPAQCRSVRTNR